MKRRDRARPSLTTSAVIAGLAALVAALIPGRAAAADPSPLSLRYISVPVSIGVGRALEIHEVNQALRDAATPELPLFMPTFGISTAARLHCGLVIEPRYGMAIGKSDEVVLVTHHMLLDVGYVLLERGEVLVYPVLGFGYGNATMELTYSGVEARPFEEVLREPVGDAVLASSALVLHGGVTVHVWGSGHGDFVGLRAGLIWSPPDAGWKRRNLDVYGGPPSPVSQAYMAIALGFDTRKR